MRRWTGGVRPGKSLTQPERTIEPSSAPLLISRSPNTSRLETSTSPPLTSTRSSRHIQPAVAQILPQRLHLRREERQRPLRIVAKVAIVMPQKLKIDVRTQPAKKKGFACGRCNWPQARTLRKGNGCPHRRFGYATSCSTSSTRLAKLESAPRPIVSGRGIYG